MYLFPTRSCFATGVVIFLLCCVISPVIAADIEMEGYLGETITLHGVSYVGDSVYLFLTGPGLPANGVTLTNTDLRADQGQFTVVGLDDNQEWSYVWKTSRIANEIDPGTYIVYVTNQPVDKSHLGGTSSYKTLSIFLKDPGTSKVSVNSGSYTLNPEEHVSTPRPAPSVNITRPSTAVTSPPPSSAVPPAPVPTTIPPTLPTRAGTGPFGVLTALLCCSFILSLLKGRL